MEGHKGINIRSREIKDNNLPEEKSFFFMRRRESQF